MQTSKSIAIILPAYNEELTIVDTMKDFFYAYPDAEIYVIDNASKDRTNELARATYIELGCKGHLLEEARKGKAAAVRKAFMEVDADIYVMADADMTYPASDLPKLLAPVILGKADIVCGNRHSSGVYSRENKRPLHDFGNKLVRRLINVLFNGSLEDILTGYRIMSKRFVKNYPILSAGFELETEMSIHALDKSYSIIELPTDYRDRPVGSFSKLDTIGDGIRVMKTIFSIFVKYRPMLFFSICAIIFATLALSVGSIPVIEYFQTAKVTRFPLAILASGLSILAMLSFAVAVILDALAAAQRFNHALALLHWHDITNEKA
jgi:glycosyltransferase involved in cell wall biosynthesis